jgi:RNA polymerase sigma-70 factor (ECF subfamily)
MNENAFVNQLLSGNEQALRQYFRLNAPKVLGFIKKKVADQSDAEELLQDTLVAGLEALRDFRGKSSISTFLCAIARNKIVDFYRKRKIKQVVFSQMPQDVLPLLSNFLGPEDAFDVQDVRYRIRSVLNSLTPVYRTVIILKYVDGLSVKEIAEKLSLTFKSTESTLFRARMAFVDLYQTS